MVLQCVVSFGSEPYLCLMSIKDKHQTAVLRLKADHTGVMLTQINLSETKSIDIFPAGPQTAAPSTYTREGE